MGIAARLRDKCQISVVFMRYCSAEEQLWAASFSAMFLNLNLKKKNPDLQNILFEERKPVNEVAQHMCSHKL